MGNRAYLELHFPKSELSQEEYEYCEAYRRWDGESYEGYEELKKHAKRIQSCWNDNFTYLPNQVPACNWNIINGEAFYSPDPSFSKKEGVRGALSWIPESWLVLFADEDYQTTREYRKGRKYGANYFLTTVGKALERINKAPFESMFNESPLTLMEIKESLENLPENVLIELDFSELMGSCLPARVEKLIRGK